MASPTYSRGPPRCGARPRPHGDGQGTKGHTDPLPPAPPQAGHSDSGSVRAEGRGASSAGANAMGTESPLNTRSSGWGIRSFPSAEFDQMLPAGNPSWPDPPPPHSVQGKYCHNGDTGVCEGEDAGALVRGIHCWWVV